MKETWDRNKTAMHISISYKSPQKRRNLINQQIILTEKSISSSTTHPRSWNRFQIEERKPQRGVEVSLNGNLKPPVSTDVPLGGKLTTRNHQALSRSTYRKF